MVDPTGHRHVDDNDKASLTEIEPESPGRKLVRRLSDATGKVFKKAAEHVPPLSPRLKGQAKLTDESDEGSINK